MVICRALARAPISRASSRRPDRSTTTSKKWRTTKSRLAN